MSGFKIIRPSADMELLSSSVPFSDVPEWSPGEVCAKGARRCVSSVGREYQSLIEPNVGNDPTASPAAWKDVSVVNRLKMFDGKLGTKSTCGDTNNIDVLLKPGIATGAAVFQTTGDVVRFTLYKPTGEVIAQKEISLRSGSIDNWFDWFFAPYEFDEKASIFDLPYYPDAELRAQIFGSSERPAACGALVVGVTEDMGFAQWGLKLGIRDYSKIEEDEFGVVDITKRDNVETVELETRLTEAERAKVYSILRRITSTWCVFLIDDDAAYQDLLIYGRVKDFSVPLSTPRVHFASLELEGGA